MRPIIKIFAHPAALAAAVAQDLKKAIRQNARLGKLFYIALAGGTTPKALFDRLAQQPFCDSIPWQTVHFYWSDERCVPSHHPDSNYGMVKTALLDLIRIPPTSIHRIHGEAEPETEARRYSREIMATVPRDGRNMPRFDWMMLGMGSDGHTASLFRGASTLSITDRICAVARHPLSGQKRITFTFPIINNATRITFLVTGTEKADMLNKILLRSPENQQLPAARVYAHHGLLIWYLDQAAAEEKLA